MSQASRSSWSSPSSDYRQLNSAAGSAILYELQARSANACRVDTGAPWQRHACASKIAPPNAYRAVAQDGQALRCDELDELQQIRLGTLDDLLEDTADHHAGITLRYIQEKVGANAVWLMPAFPNNDRWSIPAACDNLGSPYAVRDYMHVSGTLDRSCILRGIDENSSENGGDRSCWGNGALDRVIAQAHARGMKVILDVAFNHFGHNYRFYDYARFTPVRDRLARGQDPDALWDFARTFEPELLQPEILDTAPRLEAAAATDPSLGAALTQVRSQCPALSGDLLVRAVGMWRDMLDWERAQFRCDAPMYLEYGAPGFYSGRQDSGAPHPSRGVGDNLTNNWSDVKFLFHHERRGQEAPDDAYRAYVRNREYLFRVLNYWVSRGVDGFRLDHTTEAGSGLGANEWKYLIEKVEHYNRVRRKLPAGRNHLIFLAEEFHDQGAMNHVVDAMTEGYVGDMRGRDGATKEAAFVEAQLDKAERFGGHAYVMRALETHDERRLFDGTGFDPWTGAGFYGIGAASRGLVMLLMGQEFGERDQLAFRKSAYLPSRFLGHPNHLAEGADLVGFYRSMHQARLDPRNRALTSDHAAYLRPRGSESPDPRIFAQVRWTNDGGAPNVVFAFHQLWYANDDSVSQSYSLPPGLASRLSIQDSLRYRLVNVFSGQQAGECRTGAELKWNLYVRMSRSERLQWLRLETCD